MSIASRGAVEGGTFQRLEALFDEAMAQPQAGRSQWVTRACAGDAALERRLQAMLEAAGDTAADPLKQAVDQALEATQSPLLGRRIGDYQLVAELGSGGMGTVYEAVRAGADFEQHVAIKLLRLGLRDPQSLARFRRERQLLARLSHPNIAALIDGGTAEDGTPWVAMELVRGEPITAYASAGRLPLRARVTLFATLCDAVGHAHRNLVVHRDLKPANVLVTADGRPKVLDFGIGKLLDDADGGSTSTMAAAFTPSHASPEQWRGDPVTPASDVYALGLMLFELLTGELPALPTPARRSDRGAAAPVPLRRPSTVSRQVNGELESILMMALREEPARRYASATEFGADLRRWLASLPVLARPDRFAYRTRKYVQRHPFGIAMTVLLLVLAIAFVANTLLQSRRLAEERDRALREAAIARTTTDFLVELFHAPDPKMGEPGLSAMQLLERASQRIGGLSVEPLVKARLYHAIGLAYGNLGNFAPSLELLQRGLALRIGAVGRGSAEATDSMNRIGDILREAGRYREAEPYLLEALAWRARTSADPDPELADSYNNVGLLQTEIGRYGEAARHLQRAIDMHTELGSPRALAIAQHNLALVHLARGAPEQARPLVESTLAIKREEGAAGQATYANTRSLYARTLLDLGDARRALAEAEDSLVLRRQVLPPIHPQVAAGLAMRGDALAALGRHGDAMADYDEALAAATTSLGMQAWRTRAFAARRALLLERAGNLEAAIGDYRAALTAADTTFGSDSLQAARLSLDLGRALVAAGRVDEAQALLAPALQQLGRDLPAGHDAIAQGRWLLARASGESPALPTAWQHDPRLHYQLLRSLLQPEG